MLVSERKEDKTGVYREFQGLKYRYRESRKTYCNQRGGRQAFLHRVLWEYHNGIIPDKHGKSPGKQVIVPINGDWEDFSVDNWACQSHAHTGRHYKAKKHPWQEFCGVRYYLRPTEGHYYGSAGGIRVFMHRVVYTHFYGPIPEGHHIHHIDGDKSNNQPENLQCLSASDHLKLHHEQGIRKYTTTK